MSKIFTSHHNIVEFDANLQKLASSFCCGNDFIDNFLKGFLALDSAIGDSNHSWYISDVLLLDCIERIEAIRDNSLGFSFVTLASTKEGFNLYSRNDFESMEDEMQIPIVEDKESGCIPMYLPLDYEY